LLRSELLTKVHLLPKLNKLTSKKKMFMKKRKIITLYPNKTQPLGL
jgi:hypothetical protein